jgi:hypothetical protein
MNVKVILNVLEIFYFLNCLLIFLFCKEKTK